MNGATDTDIEEAKEEILKLGVTNGENIDHYKLAKTLGIKLINKIK